MRRFCSSLHRFVGDALAGEVHDGVDALEPGASIVPSTVGPSTGRLSGRTTRTTSWPSSREATRTSREPRNPVEPVTATRIAIYAGDVSSSSSPRSKRAALAAAGHVSVSAIG